MRRVVVLLVAAATLSACGSGDETPDEVVLVTHDSFAVSKPVRRAFELETGLTLRILQSGDAGEVFGGQSEQGRHQVVEPAAVAAEHQDAARRERERCLERELQIGGVLRFRVTHDTCARRLGGRQTLARHRVEVPDRNVDGESEGECPIDALVGGDHRRTVGKLDGRVWRAASGDDDHGIR